MQERQQNYRQQQNYQDRGMQWNQQQWNNGQQHYNNNSNYNSNSNQQSSFGQFGGNRFNKKYNSVPVPEDNLSQAAKNWNVYSGKEESERDWCGRAGRELKTMQKQLSEQWPDFGCEGIKVQRAHQPTSQCQGKKKKKKIGRAHV
eukprot:TRINITY_DN6192_c0_g1_i2.p4 TRINITY_DN6192_c0_g1~~TRINITY_DN6192_c0_g1_i2.p4  ORF type:complete len:145 (+),score=24.43 TRINITY_DN6192_c0_g1_i2:208-642(+)